QTPARERVQPCQDGQSCFSLLSISIPPSVCALDVKAVLFACVAARARTGAVGVPERPTRLPGGRLGPTPRWRPKKHSAYGWDTAYGVLGFDCKTAWLDTAHAGVPLRNEVGYVLATSGRSRISGQRILMILALSEHCESARGTEPPLHRATGSFDRLGSTHVQPPPQHERSLPWFQHVVRHCSSLLAFVLLHFLPP